MRRPSSGLPSCVVWTLIAATPGAAGDWPQWRGPAGTGVSEEEGPTAAPRSGEAWVVEAGKSFHLLSKNALGERTLASPAISGGRIYTRSERHLFAIGG